MNAPKVEPTEPILKQLINYLATTNTKELEDLDFGEVKFLIRNGKVYQLLITHSLLIRDKEN